jgi:mRNA interferase HigB
MWIITEKRLRQAMSTYPKAQVPLIAWVIQIRAARVAHFHELKEIFNSVDTAHGFTIFDIGGNNYRLITDVDYQMGRVYTKTFLTHTEYDNWNKTMRSSKKRSS